MSKARNKLRAGAGRDSGGFVALPWAVLDSKAYKRLNYAAKAMLLEIARQFVKDNNGRLLASMAYLRGRGWTSNETITRALRELIDAKLIHQTAQGLRPSRASWFAVTWQALDKHPGYDHGAAESFRRGAYRDGEALPVKPTRQELYTRWNKNAPLKPTIGVEGAPTAPTIGVGAVCTAPTIGAVEGVLGTSPTPTIGDHLDMPSTCEQSKRVPSARTAREAPSASREPSSKPSAAWQFKEGSDAATVLAALKAAPMSTADLLALGVANPRQRIQDLRRRGYRVELVAGKGQAARYVLLAARYVLLAAPVDEPVEVSA